MVCCRDWSMSDRPSDDVFICQMMHRLGVILDGPSLVYSLHKYEERTDVTRHLNDALRHRMGLGDAEHAPTQPLGFSHVHDDVEGVRSRRPTTTAATSASATDDGGSGSVDDDDDGDGDDGRGVDGGGDGDGATRR